MLQLWLPLATIKWNDRVITVVPGYQSRFAVDEEGNVYGLRSRSGDIKRLSCEMRGGNGNTSCGYYRSLRYNSRTRRFHVYVHDLVASTFLTEKQEGFQVDHINHDCTDNARENLRYLPVEENQKRSKKPRVR